MSSPSEFAAQTIAYVRRALGVTMETDQETLPVLDHYLRSVPREQRQTLDLVIASAGAYFGEVLVATIGGRWEAVGEPTTWRVVLTSGLSVCPAGLVASAIAQADVADFDCAIDTPTAMREVVENTLAAMGDVTEEEFFSLAGRYDTLQHLHEVIVGAAARKLSQAN